MTVADMTDTHPTPRVSWGEFYPWFLEQWEQGQHVTMVGPTGWGKSTLAIDILALRRWLVVFGVKGRDDTMDKMVRELGLTKMKSWQPDIADRICLWPDIRGAGKGHQQKQREVFLTAMNSIFRMGGWCCAFDEVVYLAEELKLDGEIKFLLNQGRSSAISIVSMTQRPAFIPVACYDMASHLFLWKFNDHRNAQRVAELTGTAAPVVRGEIMQLPKYEFLYVNKDTGLRVRSKVEV